MYIVYRSINEALLQTLKGAFARTRAINLGIFLQWCQEIFGKDNRWF